MKFGSVQFFKRLIVAVLIAVVIVPVVLAILFGVLYGREKKRADWLETVNWAMMNSAELPEDLTSAEDITQYLQNPPADFVITPSFDYQTQFPDLYYSRPAQVADTPGDKVCYLTFDDGPSPVTLQVLKTLEDYGIKGTFFVTGKNSEENEAVLQQAAKAGHTVAVHTYSHEYEEIYQSVEAFLEDFDAMHRRIVELTGSSPGVFRFAGGSINAYNQNVYNDIIAEMTRRGFTFYDWNAAAGDAVSGGVTRQEVVDNVLSSAGGKDKLVVLMHDRQDNTSTAAALPALIEALQREGYRFAPLSAEVPPVTYFYQG